MNVLIVAATQFEIEPFKRRGKEADILITGVGVPATIYQLTKRILTKKYELVIQAGIAGTCSDFFSLGDTVLIKEDTFADIGIEEKGKFQTLFETGFMNKNDFPFADGLLINNHSFFHKNLLPVAKAITVNKVTDNIFLNKINREIFSADVESMEGAAFHYVCIQQKINFLQLRSISNKVGERDKTKWKIKEAIENLDKGLLKLIDNL